jgi:hypothetical protein
MTNKLSVTSKPAQLTAKLPHPGEDAFRGILDMRSHQRAQRQTSQRDSSLSNVQYEAYDFLVQHTVNMKTISALRAAKNLGPGSVLLGLIAGLLKNYDNAYTNRCNANLKRPFQPDPLQSFAAERAFNKQNVKADDKLFEDVRTAVSKVPNSRYRKEILSILEPVQQSHDSKSHTG